MDFDVAVIGSGFGGSVAALGLAEKGYRVVVLEAGRRFSDEDFPTSNWDLRRFLWMPSLGFRGIQRLSLLRHVLVLSGAGVGGGSLVYANTLYEPLDQFYEDPRWSGITDWRQELAPHFGVARRMLGAAEVPADSPADAVMRSLAERLGVAHSFERTTVGVHFGEPGEEVPDPYFEGSGPARRGCIQCGGCMIGCRFGAKNSLDRNYLYLAERLGTIILPEREVYDLVPLPAGDISERPQGQRAAGWSERSEADPAGYLIRTRRPGLPISGAQAALRHQRPITATQVVFSAGVLGTVGLLLRLGRSRRLKGLSQSLGRSVRTNSEAIVGASTPRVSIDYSRGVAITSSIRPDQHTSIEPVRYPAGSNAMGLLATALVDGGGVLPRQLRFLAEAARHPAQLLRSLSVRRWSERTIILLVMQSLDNGMRLVLKGDRLISAPDGGPPPPSYIPVANRAARVVAELIGGYAESAWNEVLADIPTTAHIVGGACLSESAQDGVVDPYHRVFGHPRLHIMDGSVVPANLGANPSLAITAMAERAVSMWPNVGEPDPRPEPLTPYRSSPRVAPRNPAVSYRR